MSLTFDQPSRRVVELVIRANVRPTMTLTAKGVSLGAIREGSGVDCECEIGNFGDQDWSAVDMVSCPPWPKVVRVSQSRRAWKAVSPRQTWTIQLHVDTVGLAPAAYRDLAEFRARGTEASAAIPFSLAVPKSVTAASSLIMLGSIERGKPAEASTILAFHKGLAPLRPEDLAAKFGRLTSAGATFTRLSEERWLLKVRIDPAMHAGEFLSDELVVRFPKGNLPELSIPIRGRIIPQHAE